MVASWCPSSRYGRSSTPAATSSPPLSRHLYHLPPPLGRGPPRSLCVPRRRRMCPFHAHCLVWPFGKILFKFHLNSGYQSKFFGVFLEFQNLLASHTWPSGSGCSGSANLLAASLPPTRAPSRRGQRGGAQVGSGHLQQSSMVEQPHQHL